ncbi:TolC family protein [Gillisia sp. Hel_I_29]|uniref:TolC family protein n=1 Tax=Gillisia sp. Hel_I_29 TaxID=1249975 RepID=UPI000550F6B3|nr:TolC family protein [Gillisia sp. Hel_I_29]
MQLKLNKIVLIYIIITTLNATVSNAQELDPALKYLIQKAVDKSHSLNINQFEAEQAKVDALLAKSALLPKLTFNGSFTRLDDDITFDSDTQNLLISTQKLLVKEAIGIPFNAPFPENIPLTDIPNLQDKNILKSSVDLNWTLFSGLEVTNAVRASEHKKTSIIYKGLADKDKIALKIIEYYDKLALVYASKKVISTSKEYLDDQEYYIKKAIENGLATPISRKKIELAQQQLNGKELEYDHNRVLIIESLHQLTGESKERLMQLAPQLDSLENSSSTSTEKRNEVKALEEAELATLFKSKMEKSSYIPKLGLKGHYEFIEDDLSLLDPKWFLGVGVSWNVFDGFQAVLKSKKSMIESQKYREQIEEAEEMIDLSIIKAKLTLESSIQNTKIVEKEIDLANATYTMVNKQYKNNLATITEVLDALTDLEKANFKLQESYFDQRRAVTELLHAKGIITSFYNQN